MAELYKIRSIGGCMKSAFDLYATNLKTIILRSWIPALIMSVCISAMVIVMQIPNAIIAAVTSTLFGLLAYAGYTWFNCTIVSLLNGKSFRSNLPRVIRLVLLLLCISIILFGISELAGTIPFFIKGVKGINEQTLILSAIITFAMMLIFALLTLPLWYSSFKYVMQPNSKLTQIIGHDYIGGLKHWGYLFIIALLTLIILGVIYIVLYIPIYITMQAMQFDTIGKVLGDSSGLPTYFNILVFFTVIVISFVNTYVLTWACFNFYYAYGHIEAKNKAKIENKTKDNRTFLFRESI